MHDDLELNTARLILRPVRLEDFAPWAVMKADPEAMRFLGGAQSAFAAWLTFRVLAGGWYLDGYSRFSVIERTSGRWVGWVGPLTPEGWPGPEIGWGIARECWGRGYATEGAMAAIDWSFEHLGWNEVTHCIEPDNVMAQRVARKLCSSNRGCVLIPSVTHDVRVEVWGQSREHWEQFRAVRRLHDK